MEKRTWKLFSWNTLLCIVLACAINAVIWIASHGVPLIGMPDQDDVKRVTISYHDYEVRELEDTKDIQLLTSAVNLLVE